MKIFLWRGAERGAKGGRGGGFRGFSGVYRRKSGVFGGILLYIIGNTVVRFVEMGGFRGGGESYQQEGER